jgi:hypothetical protein
MRSSISTRNAVHHFHTCYLLSILLRVLIDERMDVIWKVQLCDPPDDGFLETETYVGAF